MPSSLTRQREKLKRYVQALSTPVSEKQRYNRQQQLQACIEETIEILKHTLNQIYKQAELNEVSHILEILTEVVENPFRIQKIFCIITARLQAYQDLMRIVKTMYGLEYRLHVNQDVTETIQQIQPIIEIYNASLREAEMTANSQNLEAPFYHASCLCHVRHLST